MDIIDFFRSIDGILYYVILVTNTILIFAIIGYLGDKGNEKYLKMSNVSQVPVDNDLLNFNSTTKHSNASIPTVAPTMINNTPMYNQNNNNQPQNVEPSLSNANPLINNTVDNINSNNNLPTVNPKDNEIDPNEKAPAVLVINSSNTNIPK